ncbi:isoaspartyl peptidase/L-asparaginase [Sphingomicrobium sp. XHP0239]|uniref:isoaspartyl peptidase/L-asparaginase family protein n=1 Tax=Sphingomicrobium maritimum TaxID=3133972 RepID=UPI0031CC6F35
MTRFALALAALIALPATAPSTARAQEAEPRWSLVIHGGAGTIRRESMTPEKDAEIRAKLDEALVAGSEILAAGGSSLDAIQAAIMVLEDDPNFNAGRGAVFTWEGTNSLDSSIMRGDTLEAGAVAGLSTTKNPILAARAVMEQSPHVLLSGEGADTFASEQGIEQVDPDYFYTQERYDALTRFKENAMRGANSEQLEVDYKFGTVGAVAMDVNGVISAGTSTGGMTGKRWGRIGDSPIIGAGTYANDLCGVSATGTGEYFIRLNVAAAHCSQVGLNFHSAQDAARRFELLRQREDSDAGIVYESFEPATPAEISRLSGNRIIRKVGELGGSGGIIYLAPDGTPGWSFDTPGMYRGSATSADGRTVAIYGDEE